MASAALNFATLKPDNLPASDAALDVYIIRGQDVILSQFFHNDTALNWQFERFVTDFKNRFNQDIVVSKQDYNQILVLKNSQFSFVDFNHPNMFLCKNSTHLSQIALLFSQIIEQENAFLIQLQSFQSMLHSAEILKSPLPTEPPVTKSLARRDVSRSFLSKNSSFLADFVPPTLTTARNNTKTEMSKVKKRSIADIFTPYSVTSIGDTANENYRKMNSNFRTIHVSESKLAHAQSTLSDNFFKLQEHEVDLLRKEIFLELRTLKESALSSFLFDLQQILATNHLDKAYQIVFSLLRTSEFCQNNLCYSLPIFNSIAQTLVVVNVQITQQSLARGFYISCSVLNNQRTSIYSHRMAIYEDNLLHFKDNTLPSVSFNDLKNPSIDLLSRPIADEDKLEGKFYPIYYNKKVSFQCLTPMSIQIDEQTFWCDDKTLQFVDFPKSILVDGKKVLSIAIPEHFSMKIARMTSDFEIISKFQPLNRTEPHLVEEVIEYFQVAESIHWSLLTMGIILTLSLFIMICFCSYIKCPTLMSKILQCCCSNTCCVLQCLYRRIRDTEILRTQMESGTSDENMQMINLSQARDLSRPSNTSTESSGSVVLSPPTAPNLSQFSDVVGVHPNPVIPVSRPKSPPPPPPNSITSVPCPIPTPMIQPPQYTLRDDQPLASSVIIQPQQSVPQSACKNNYSSCFCNLGGICHGPMQNYFG